MVDILLRKHKIQLYRLTNRRFGMSDYHRTVMSSPFGQATGRTTVAIDEGLRAYMLHVYNYMVFGLAITGLAALGIYMASVTGDPRRRQNPPQRRRSPSPRCPRHVSHIDWLRDVREPSEMDCHPRSSRPGIRAELRDREASSCDGTAPVLDFRSLDGFVPRLDLHGLHAYFDRARVLHHRSVIWGAKPLGVYDAT